MERQKKSSIGNHYKILGTDSIVNPMYQCSKTNGKSPAVFAATKTSIVSQKMMLSFSLSVFLCLNLNRPINTALSQNKTQNLTTFC